ncbi:protein YgfX [Paraburkholderia kururiensis]|uniref:protein YgfX n=1 Tax=Paraburkholderia kururiensis TaxID=984307 RepID=UPI0039A44B94
MVQRLAPRRIALRPSGGLQIAVFCFIAVAVAAVHTSLAPWLGGWRALPLSLAVLALLALVSAALRRGAPAAIEIGPDAVSAFDRRGVRVAQGLIAASSQWGAWLLVLVLASGRRRYSLVIPADALHPDAFRELSVIARCGGRG